MCLLIYKPAGKSLDRETLINASITNPDGAGIAYATGQTVEIAKNAKWDGYDVHRELKNLTDAPALIHFRWATHGAVTNDNAHPFALHGGIAGAHNGVISGYGKGDVSDTRDFFAREVVPFLARGGKLESRGFKRHARRWERIIGHSKLAFIDPTGTVSLVREDLGEWVDGIWFSNLNHEYSQFSFPSLKRKTKAKAWKTGGWKFAPSYVPSALKIELETEDEELEEMEDWNWDGEKPCDGCWAYTTNAIGEHVTGTRLCDQCVRDYCLV